jgi:hypothetical protein
MKKSQSGNGTLGSLVSLVRKRNGWTLREMSEKGVYLDSAMGHAYTAKDCDSALVLAVCSSEDPDLARELISLAESEAVPTWRGSEPAGSTLP